MTKKRNMSLRARLPGSTPQARQDKTRSPKDAAEAAFGSFLTATPRLNSEVKAEVDRLLRALSMQERMHLMSGDGPFIRGTRDMSKR